MYGDDVEVDYRGYEVTVENFVRLLTGRLPESTPSSKRLLTDAGSNILIYMTGHGGDGFLKFQVLLLPFSYHSFAIWLLDLLKLLYSAVQIKVVRGCVRAFIWTS